MGALRIYPEFGIATNSGLKGILGIAIPKYCTVSTEYKLDKRCYPLEIELKPLLLIKTQIVPVKILEIHHCRLSSQTSCSSLLIIRVHANKLSATSPPQQLLSHRVQRIKGRQTATQVNTHIAVNFFPQRQAVLNQV